MGGKFTTSILIWGLSQETWINSTFMHKYNKSVRILGHTLFNNFQSQFKFLFCIFDFFCLVMHINIWLYTAEEKIRHCFEQVSGNGLCCSTLILSKIDAFSIVIKMSQKLLFSWKLLKTMLDFFFCQVQLHIELYYDEEKTRKNPNIKI